jgi:hypothetical protein
VFYAGDQAITGIEMRALTELGNGRNRRLYDACSDSVGFV